MERAVFLDRDGTIIEDTGYPHERDKIKFLPRVSEAIRLLNQNGFKVIITTNQSGVARGYFTKETVQEINRYIQESLARQGATIDKMYYCPHHVEGTIEEYRKECYCRKPNPGMIEEAIGEFDIDSRNSFVIGDKISDIEAGRRAGCKAILLVSEDSLNEEAEAASAPDLHIVTDLYQAAEWVIKSSAENKKE